MKKWTEAYEVLINSEHWSELKKYKHILSRNYVPSVKQIWWILDDVWVRMGLNNRYYTEYQLQKYYSHSVWFLNGLFIEVDEQSIEHRKSLAKFFVNKKDLRILDYGGGFGTLAKEIAKQTPSSIIEIYEPHASKYAIDNIKEFNNIKIVDSICEHNYDVVVNTDVLEHVENPIQLVGTFNQLLKDNGVLIAHWNFTPCIKCHLPKHFHFQYTFGSEIVPLLGFSKEISNRFHGHYYIKKKNITPEDLKHAYFKEKLSKKLYTLNVIQEKFKK